MPSDGLRHKPIIGYTDPLCVAPGESIELMVSTSAPSYEASVVKLRHGDPASGGPGLRYVGVDSEVEGTYDGVEQPLRLGSYIEVPHFEELSGPGGFTLQAWIWPTTPDSGLQGIFTKWSEASRTGFGLFIEPKGAISLRLDGEVFACSAPVRPFEWTLVAASYDPESNLAAVWQLPATGLADDPARQQVSSSAEHWTRHEGPLVLGGHHAEHGPLGTYNGKVDSPRFFSRALTDEDVDRLASGVPAGEVGGLRASWQLGIDTDDNEVTDDIGRHLGRCVNHPTRGVTGHNWRGEETAFFRAPEEFNAVLFHVDDLEDAHWEPSFSYAPAATTPSGVYAFRLRTAAGAEDWVPFFVRPPRGQATAPIGFLAPTFSYLAYANDHSAAAVHTETAAFDVSAYYQAEDHYVIETPVCGLYDHHPDGLGVCYSSWRRPLATIRPSYHLPVARSAHQLSADLHVIDWLEEKGFDHDLITDHDLHDDGVDLLRPYRVIVTGTHPEYWSAAMLDALEEYLADGGRLFYTGGNGFYWVTSVSPSRPHLIEVRRGRRGTGSWRSEPGEDHHSTTGELGGLWRDRGRAPQRLAGVGMAAQGFGQACGYRRQAAGHDADVAWIFEGVEGDEIPLGGLVLGGPAGFEIDRFDRRLGAPPSSRLLATATGFSDDYQHVVEEVSTSDSHQGGSVSPYVRADMVYAERPNGGATFATGSIAWSGALSLDNYNSAVSVITENVLRRFSS
jgi:N,N-dimethylformamidase